MRALHYGLLLLTICTAALAGAPTALAQPVVGCTPEYLRGFEVMNSRRQIVWRPGEIECVEYFRFNVSTPGGQRTFRAIGDLQARALLRPGDIAKVEAGARRAAASMAALGDYRVDNVTFLISLYNSTRADREDWSRAWASDQSRRPANECPVTLFAFQEFEGESILYTMAHELFHCIQFRSLSSAQNITYDSGGKWWIEGSADLFAAFVVPAEAPNRRRAHTFREAVEAKRPLYFTGYGAAVFFYWYHHRNGGLASLMPFLRRMASSPGESAQRAAIRAAISSEALLQFAKDYDDRKIKYPNGRIVDLGPLSDNGAWWAVTRNVTLEQTVQPFVITLGWADYTCGVWANEFSSRGVNYALREERQEGWISPWPSEVDGRREGTGNLRYVMLHTGDSNVNASLRVERRLGCESCLVAGENHIDACLVGTWEMTGGGPMEWMARRMRNTRFTRNNNTKTKVTMFDDGTFRQEVVGVDFQTTTRRREGTDTFDARGRSATTLGYWSARNGTMRACTLNFSAQGTITGTSTRPGTTSMHSVPSNFSTGPTEGESRYNCSATTYKSSIRMNDGSDMDFVFTRLSPPPPTR